MVDYPLGTETYYSPEQGNVPDPVISVAEPVNWTPDWSPLVSVPTTIGVVDTIVLPSLAILKGISILPNGVGIKVIIVIQSGTTTIVLPYRAGTNLAPAGQTSTVGTPVDVSTVLNINLDHPFMQSLQQATTITVSAVAATSGQSMQILYNMVGAQGVQ